MKMHLAWLFPIALVALTGPRVSGSDDGPSLFVIPQAVKQTSPTQAGVKKISPAQPGVNKTSPAQPGIRKTTAAQPGAEKTTPAQAGADKTAPTQVGIDKTVPDVKTPYTGKRVVNRPVTMPSQMPDNRPNRSDSRILSGAGPGTIGSYRARLELRPNGTFVVTGNIEGSGTWHQSGQTIVMESPTSHYEGSLENSTISGTRTFKERAGIEPWKFVLNDRALEIKLEVQGR
jgi:hypothetical protein